MSKYALTVSIHTIFLLNMRRTPLLYHAQKSNILRTIDKFFIGTLGRIAGIINECFDYTE